MRVLVTGGTGLIGRATVAALRERGHLVRTVSRRAKRAADSGIEAWPASVSDADALRNAAADCDVVLHIAGIVAESPPDLTFRKVNVDGTANILSEAARAGVRRFVYVSSLGADSGRSEYHKSKLNAEQLVRAWPGEWLIARPGNVYGPGDEVMSKLVRYARALPTVPLINDGEQPFQPVWHADLATALVAIVDGSGSREVLEIAGPDVVTLNSVFDTIGELTHRKPPRVSVDATLASRFASIVERVGLEPPVHTDTIQMLLEGNCIGEGKRNALIDLLPAPTPVREGLRRLLQELPVQKIADGFGKPQHRRVQVRIENSHLRAAALFNAFIADYRRFLPVDAGTEPDSPRQLHEGAVLPMTLPIIGNFSVRVEEAFNQAVTLSTLDGHPLAGFVRFTFADDADAVVCEIHVYDRPANAVSSVGMALGGNFAQERAWRTAAERMLEACGGVAHQGVQHEVHDLDESEVARVQEWFEQLTSLRRGTSGPQA